LWGKKLSDNVHRDSRQTLALERDGWRLVRIWEHDLKRRPDAMVAQVLKALKGRQVRNLAEWRVVEVEVLDAAQDLERRHLIDLRVPRRRRVEERTRTTSKA
jgi:G:T-mismatch repair DNA endonuclease (very short patch repair protein)